MKAELSVLLLACAACAPVAAPCPSCAAGEFCCFGQCLASGSMCGLGGDGGMTDAGAFDAGAPAPCDARARPDGGTAVVASHCVSNARVSCLNGDATACAEDRHCVERFDSPSRLFVASCVRNGEEPCDVPGFSCRQSLVLECKPDGARNVDGPPFSRAIYSDCAADSPGAQCVARPDGGFRCEQVACDASEVDRCEDRVQLGCDATTGTRYRDDCGALGAKCVTTPELWGRGTTCVPTGAVPAGVQTHESCLARRAVSCEHDDVFRVAYCGYTWLERCDIRTFPTGRPPQECYTLPTPMLFPDGGVFAAVGCRRTDMSTCNLADNTFLRCADGEHQVQCRRGVEETTGCFGRGCSAAAKGCL